ncbi:MAG: DUF3488 domain-containing protein [Desulfobacteraceae bacterium]|nr:MAG: DUF3488 domain-containing protein [Desulfobacteraceae bacterium]
MPATFSRFFGKPPMTMIKPENESREMGYLIGALVVALVPHIPSLPIWINTWCFLAFGYMILSLRKKWRQPPRWIRIVLTCIGIAGILSSSGHQIGSSTYQSLLAIMATLKPLEIRSHRDKMITLFFAYFIMITSLFQSESLLISLYMFFSVFVTTAVLIQVNHPGNRFPSSLRLSGKILIQAFPLMVILFLLFPRIEGSMWGITPRSTARSGFSDTLSPGNISRLVLNSEIAFRARFPEARPKPDQLYWRGIVFSTFDGRNWKTDTGAPLRKNPVQGKQAMTYQIRLEAGRHPWLFALDLPVSGQQDEIILADHTIRSGRNIVKPIQYQVTSYLTYNTGPMHSWEEITRSLPESGNQMARALAEKWRRENSRPELIIQRALAYFTENPFSYTLKPPILKKQVIDDFLFRSRKGYCEHYASAFAFLMRAAGIPSRIVAGYLGGETNPYGDFLVIRQYHAHAWTEVWLDSRGWVRIDPTSLIAPDRIELGPAGGLPAEDLPDNLLGRDFSELTSFRNQFYFFWEAVNNQWDIWFSGYSHLEQKSFFEQLGLNLQSSWKRAAVLLLILTILAIAFLLFLMQKLHKTIVGPDIVQEAYEKFCAGLRQIGIIRKPDQGPADFAAQIRSLKPDIAHQADEIITLYIRIRYMGKTTPEDEKRLQELVNRFDPVRKT